MNTAKIMAAALSLAATGAFAMPDGWTDDFDAAKAEAAKEGKLLLVDFSGSDWCGWCKKLDNEVFAKPEFVEGAKKDFVLVLIDSPRDKSILSEKAKEQNPGLVSKYNIQGFPTVLVMDAEGNKLANTGYRRGGPEGYLKHLAALKTAASAKVEFLKAVAGMEKSDPARLGKIEEFLGKLDDASLDDEEAFVMELLAADKDGKYAKKYPKFAYVKPIEKKFEAFLEEVNSEAMRRFGELGQNPTSEQKDAILKDIDAKVLAKVDEFLKEAEDVRAKAPEAAKALDEFSTHVNGLKKMISERGKSVKPKKGGKGKAGKAKKGKKKAE
jgi:thiol-disulfide isomerase/thioredoxin